METRVYILLCFSNSLLPHIFLFSSISTNPRKQNKTKQFHPSIITMEMDSHSHSQTPPHIAILASPGMGHLIPLLEFAKNLVQNHNFLITFLLPSPIINNNSHISSLFNSQKSLLSHLPNSISHIFLPHNLNPHPNTKMETIISLSISHSLSSIKTTLQSLSQSSNLVGLIVDLFGVDAFQVAKKMNLFYYLFFPSSAMSLSFCLHLSKLDKVVNCEYRDYPEMIQIPGCVPIHGKDLPSSVQDRENQAYKLAIHRTELFRFAHGILLNSFEDLEPGAIKALQQEEEEDGDGNSIPKPPIYAIGPLVNMDHSNSTGMGIGNFKEWECLKWLDFQPKKSVLFVSFGSGGTLSNDQIKELALGLEMSGQRFMWVTRNPNEKTPNGAFFGGILQSGEEESKDPFDFLPNGFIERTKERGLVMGSWAPQPQILTHDSIGGFLSHCGWNSILESVVNGVPLIAWPLYAEQKMNAVMLEEGIGVALRPKFDAKNGIVGREEIAGLVQDLVLGEREGKWVHSKMKDLKILAARVVGEDGSSTNTLSQLALKWSTQVSS